MITNLLLISTIAVSLVALQRQDIFHKLLFNAYAVKHQRQWERFFTHTLVHADWPHLLFNMIALWSFGRVLEEGYFLSLFGKKAQLYYSLLYLGGAIVAAIPSYIKHQNNTGYNSVGASGAVSAVVFSCILIDPTQTISVYFIRLPGILFGIIYLAYSWYMDKKGQDNIGHDAHFWGAIYGIGFTLLLEPRLLFSFIQQLTTAFF